MMKSISRAAAAAILTMSAGLTAVRAAEVDVLLQTETTAIGQPIVYPTKGTPKVTSAIVTLAPGEETGTHQHPIPLYGYILEGQLTVVYDDGKGTTVHLEKGDAVVEAHDVWHDGRNPGDTPTRILVFYMGDTEQPNTIMKDPK